jgi:hypothetical protein
MSQTSNPFPALLIVLGLAVMAAGAWWIYRPAGLIVGGLMLLTLGWFGRSPASGGR